MNETAEKESIKELLDHFMEASLRLRGGLKGESPEVINRELPVCMRLAGEIRQQAAVAGMLLKGDSGLRRRLEEIKAVIDGNDALIRAGREYADFCIGARTGAAEGYSGDGRMARGRATGVMLDTRG